MEVTILILLAVAFAVGFFIGAFVFFYCDSATPHLLEMEDPYQPIERFDITDHYFDSISVCKVLDEVMYERKKQNVKWGEQNHNLTDWIAILTEEVGEASKEAVKFRFRDGLKSLKNENRQIVIDDIQETRLKNYRKELIQVAAVSVQMIESLDRGYY